MVKMDHSSACLDNLKRHREFSLSLLLGLQVFTTFVLVPLIDINGHNRWVLNVCVAAMGFVSVFIVENSVRRWLAIFILGLCLTGIVFIPLFAGYKASGIIVIVSALLFSTNVCWILFSKVFNSGPVTSHKMRGAIVIYLNIAVLFALVHSLIASCIPDAYSTLPKNPGNLINTMIYFSFSTLTTTGYGDFVPVHPVARSVAMLEAVIGQFYMGILIATLIGQFVSHKQKSIPTGQ